MNPMLINIIMQHIVIPELAAWLAQRRASGQPMPTRDDILDHMGQTANLVIEAGEAFLASKAT